MQNLEAVWKTDPGAIVFRCLSGTAGQQPPVVASDGMPRGREGNSGAAGGRVGGRVSAAGGDEVGATLEVESHIGRCGLTQDCIGQWTAASHAEKTSARLCCNRVLTVDTHTPQRKLCRLVDIWFIFIIVMTLYASVITRCMSLRLAVNECGAPTYELCVWLWMSVRLLI